MSILTNDQGFSADLLKTVRAIMTGEELEEAKKMDPVGKEDGDIDNDGDKDDSDEYLMKRRKAIKKSMKDDDQEDDDSVKVNAKKEQKESADLDKDNVDKALKHDCATHVVHEKYGAGECIPGMHDIVETEDGEGYVTKYDVMFMDEEGKPFIVESIPVEEMKVTKEMSHGHKRKK